MAAATMGLEDALPLRALAYRFADEDSEEIPPALIAFTEGAFLLWHVIEVAHPRVKEQFRVEG